jgi:multidrug efflux pump subunit AcrA (membrane-fusion protein)
MRSITGKNRRLQKQNRKKMKCKINLVITFLGLTQLIFPGCENREEPAEKEVFARIPATVTTIQRKTLTEYFELTAVSSFQGKSDIQSPTASYIEEIDITPGDYVHKDQLILLLKTKEAAALKNDSLNPLGFSGNIRIKSATEGIVTNIHHAKGDFVMEGEPLVTIAVPASFVFLTEVPFEFANKLLMNHSCEIFLSDGQKILGTIKSRLSSISGSSQTLKFIIKPRTDQNLPENLVAKIRVVSRMVPDAVVLPKSCILSDEVMKEFWVMKLVNDSTAIKTPVKTGITEGDLVEITDPLFSTADRIMLTGNYGLGDTVKVVVTKNE